MVWAVMLLGLASGLAWALGATVLHRPFIRSERAIHRLPLERFRNAIVLPVASIFAGAIAGIGSNLLTNQPDRLLFVCVFVAALFVALVVVVVFGHLEPKPATPVGDTAMGYRRELLAELRRRDWTTATRDDRATATRQATRLAATGRRLITYAESRSFRQWLRRRHPLQLTWFATATAITTTTLLYVVGIRTILAALPAVPDDTARLRDGTARRSVVRAQGHRRRTAPAAAIATHVGPVDASRSRDPAPARPFRHLNRPSG